MKMKNAIPVYDICSLSNSGDIHTEIIAEPFSSYLEQHPNLCRTHGHSFYHLVLFTRGKGFHTIDFERYAVTAGQLYFMAPGQVHSWAFEGNVDGYIVNFSEDLFHSFFATDAFLGQFAFLQGVTGDNVVQLPPVLLAKAKDILAQVVDEVRAAQLSAKDMVRMLLVSLFIITARASSKKEQVTDIAKPGLMLVHHFRRLVNMHYNEYKLPKDYAALLYVTPNHLNAVCRELLGKSAGQVIRERIILEARRRLVNADAGIAGIGYELGFPDNSYFTKFFKKYTGTTPEDFKKGLLPASR